MRRIDRIRMMSVSEMADAIMEAVGYCPVTQECDGGREDSGQAPQAMCRKCLIKWLMEEAG